MNSSLDVLLVQCPDRVGIIARTTSFFADCGVNIVESEQYTDQTSNTFFQRIVFQRPEGTPAAQTLSMLSEQFAPVATQMSADYWFRSLDDRPRVALLASKESHCLVGVLQRWSVGDLNMEPVVIISDRKEPSDAAGWFDIPFVYLPVMDGDKASQELVLRKTLEDYEVELAILARYMRILSPEFCSDYMNRCINVHHSFLPAFVGANPYQQAFDRGVKVIGATSHYVTEELDQGPIIAQRTLDVTHKDTADVFVRKGRELETGALVDAVHAHLEHRVIVSGSRALVFG